MYEPITEPLEALELLFTPSRDQAGAMTKCLMPYPMLGPKPRGISEGEHRYLPFIEWCWYGGVCDIEFLDAKDFFVTSRVADALIREKWVEETLVHVYEISLLGIAIAAARRQKKLESEIGNGNAPASE